MDLGIFSRQPVGVRRAIVALVLGAVLILLDSKNPEWFRPLRDASHSAMQSVYQLSLFPSFVGHWSEGTLQSKEALRRQNVQLKAQLLQAHAKLQQQDYLLAQNARLQGILSTTKADDYHLELAQVIGTDSNPLKQVVVLNKGQQDGVQVGQTVIDENGIIGQIINVYPHTSRLLLITDEDQSIAVIIKRTGQKAIVTGEGTPDSLSLDYIFKASDVEVGDELLSSGLGGRVPAGYKVGQVALIHDEQSDNFAKIKVTPASNLINTSYVLILQDKAGKNNAKSPS